MREHTDEELIEAREKLLVLKTSAQVQGDTEGAFHWGSALDIVSEEMLTRNL